MNKHVEVNPSLDFVFERFIDAPTRLVWEALTKPEHLKEWYMPKLWGRVVRAEMDLVQAAFSALTLQRHTVRYFPISVASWKPLAIPTERLVWTSMLFPCNPGQLDYLLGLEP